eukprot:PLAT11633.1.p1 GENE.PLAT11633.1~~PLAT11633.1.p1  ORF type:complete len:279 (-),score=108.71 PLAT11633.1:176-958(-)
MSGKARKSHSSSAKRGKKPYQRPESAGHPLFKSRPKNLGIGGDIRVKTDLTRYVKWPRVVRLQRQRKVLWQRLKVPPQIAQFQRGALDRNAAAEVFRLLLKYQPETAKEKRARLKEGESKEGPGPVLKFGFNHVTYLIEQKAAKLVVIAHDVAPIEIIVWMPALCRMMEVPYCIVKGKSRLGQLVHRKNAACVALTEVNRADVDVLETLRDRFMESFNNNPDHFKQWGGGILGAKSQNIIARKEKIMREELAKRQAAAMR